MQTKDISNKDIEQPKSYKLQQFSFPQLGLTVEAETLEEAQEKLKKLINQ